jgi:hypothetical protein
MGRVVIGMDPHKRSATIEVLDEAEQPVMAGRFGTDSEGYRLLLAAGRQFPHRLWAVEGVVRRSVPPRRQLVSIGGRLLRPGADRWPLAVGLQREHRPSPAGGSARCRQQPTGRLAHRALAWNAAPAAA